MSKHKDYTRYSNQRAEAKETIVGDRVAIAEIPVVESAEETKVEVENNQPVKPKKIGVVADCITLNVRKEPDINSEVICSIPCLTEVVIDDSESTKDFYKVCTPAGIEGFCMVKFVKVRS